MGKGSIVDKIRDTINDFCNKIGDKGKSEDKKTNAQKGKSNKAFNTTCLVLVGILLLFVSKIFTGGFNQNSQVTFANKQQSEKSDKELKMDESNTTQLSGDSSLEKYNNKLNNQLKNILSKIEGVGSIESMIYFESGEEHVPAINVSGSNSVTDETDTSGGKRQINQNNNGETVVVLNEGSDTKPLITKTNQPKITGVCIVAEGAEDKVTELRITRAVVNLFGLPSEKVQVYPMKK